MSLKIKKLLQFGLDNNLEIMSYGFAPNPNGFCFENHGNASNKVLKYFSDQLDALDCEETEELRKVLFE